LGDRNTSQVGDGLDGIQERTLHGGFDQTPLKFVGERAGGQSQRPIQRKDTGHAGARVAHTNEFDRSKDGGESASAQPAMRVEQVAVLVLEVERGTLNYRKNNVTLQILDPVSGPEYPAGSPCAAFPLTQTRSRFAGVLLQRNGAEADDEVRQNCLRLPLRP
jgi:hypothetical protein